MVVLDPKMRNVKTPIRYLKSFFLNPIFYKSYNGVKLYFGEKVVTNWIRDAIHKGFYEHDECSLLKKYLGEEDTVVEIGAGIGLTSAIVSKKTKESTHIEANGDLVSIIKINILLNANNNGNHKIIEAAVTAEDMADTVISLHKSQNFWNAALVERDIHGEKVNQKSLYFGNLIEDKKPNFLIMDVEGYELEIVTKNQIPEYIAKLMLEIHPKAIGESGVNACIAILEKQGFSKIDESGNSVMMTRTNKAII